MAESVSPLLQRLFALWEAWGWFSITLAVVVLAALALHALVFRALAGLARRTPWRVDDALVRELRSPGRWALVLGALALGLRVASTSGLVPGLDAVLRHALSLAAIAVVAGLVLGAIRAAVVALRDLHPLDRADNLEARGLQTRITVLSRAFSLLVFVVAISIALMTFPRVRELGASLLASAGLAGLALGLAARPVLENLVSGMQLAFTQPIRIDDVVVIEGEWGRVEEITATYVVVRIWDQRRLIVPFSRIIQQPFQNWTRTSAEILGTVFLHVDYSVPVSALRAELERIVAEAEEWDGRVCGLQVTELGSRSVELRALMSAADASKAWDLRCRVREELVGFLQNEYPGSLPRLRVEGVEGPRDGSRESPAALA
jgi:small-conductance mechanosensitive channel